LKLKRIAYDKNYQNYCQNSKAPQKAQIIKRTINSGKYLPSEIMKVKNECHLTIGALTNR